MLWLLSPWWVSSEMFCTCQEFSSSPKTPTCGRAGDGQNRACSAFCNKTPWLASGTDQEQGFRCWWLCEGTATGGCLPDEELLPPDFHFWLLWVPEALIKSFPTRSPDSAPPPPAISSSFPGLWGPALPKASLVQGEKKNLSLASFPGAW